MLIRNLLTKIKHDDILGFSGSLCLLGGYYLTTNDKSSNLILIDLLNLYGASAVSYNCYIKRAFSPMILEISWASIATYSLYKKFK